MIKSIVPVDGDVDKERLAVGKKLHCVMKDFTFDSVITISTFRAILDSFDLRMSCQLTGELIGELAQQVSMAGSSCDGHRWPSYIFL
jgi:hypothetical protein